MSKHLSSMMVAVFAAAMLYPAPVFARHRPGSGQLNGYLTGVLGAVLASAMFFAGAALADHRPIDVVVMGGTISQTGREAVRAGLIWNGRKMYVDELNARGGLLGHTVELKIHDDRSDKRTAIELYERLITDEKVDLVLGPYGSRLTDPVANIMERYKQPFIAHATNPAIYQRGRKYIFSIPNPSARDRPKGSLHVAKEIGIERIAIISTARATNLHIVVGAQEWAKRIGLKVVLSERYPETQKDFTDLLQRIKASGAEAIISIASLPETVIQLQQLRQLKINLKMFATSSAARLPEFVEELGSTAEYVVGYSAWEPKPVLGYPGIKAFVENYQKNYGVKPSHHAAAGYAAMQILVTAVKEARDFDPENVRNALTSLKVDTVRGSYKASNQGLSRIDTVAIQIQNGERVIVWPEHQAEAKFLSMPKWEERVNK